MIHEIQRDGDRVLLAMQQRNAVPLDPRAPAAARQALPGQVGNYFTDSPLLSFCKMLGSGKDVILDGEGGAHVNR